MRKSDALLKQARMDHQAAERFAQEGPTEWCQVIAKHQQCVEKSVEALIEALSESGRINASLPLRHEVEPLISLLIHLPRASRNRAIQNQLHSLFDQTVRGDIRALDALIPRIDPIRNTEYPFRTPAGEWTYPAAADTFTREELQRFRSLARRVIDGTELLIYALRRQPS